MGFFLVYLLGYAVCFSFMTWIVIREQKKWLVEDLFISLGISAFSWLGCVMIFALWLRDALNQGFGKKVLWEGKKPEVKK